jgi:SLOG cluster2
MVNDPELVPRSALKGKRVALSVSESDDLARLGLHSAHLELAVAELTRAIVFAGGIVVYGGSIGWGFTSIVLDEAERYGSSAGAFEHYVPYTEHSGVAQADLDKYARGLSVKARVRLIDATGVAREVADASATSFPRGEVDSSDALTAMRKVTSDVSDARVILGGKVAGFAGAFPGVAEEAALTATRGKPIFIAGGFGGASTLVGRIARPDLYAWLPAELPAGVTPEVEASVSDLLPGQFAEDGLTTNDRALLAQTNRPADVATLSILGLSKLSA